MELRNLKLTQQQFEALAQMLIRTIQELHQASKHPSKVLIHRAIHMNNITMTKEGQFQFIKTKLEEVPMEATFTQYKIPAALYNAYNVKKLLLRVATRHCVVRPTVSGGADPNCDPSIDPDCDEVQQALQDTAQSLQRVINVVPLPASLKTFLVGRG